MIMDELAALRARVLLGGMLLLLAGLAAMLWRIQVSRTSEYERTQLKQSVRRVMIPGMRGLILDRTGAPLAENRPSFNLVLYPEEFRQPKSWEKTVDAVDAAVDRIARILRRPREITRADIASHVRLRLPLPLTAWRNLDAESQARWAEHADQMDGADIAVEYQRIYPEEGLACHVIGYVGRADPPQQDEAEPYHYYIPDLEGRQGIEKRFDGALRGRPAGRLVRVDVTGYRHRDLTSQPPHPGSNVVLAIDRRIQRAVEEGLTNAAGGACVVLDPRNGDVLALASSPGYDLSQFVPVVPGALWQQLTGDSSKPLVNRAIAGGYPPGSTFKPVVALAALEGGFITPQTKFDCPGYLQVGPARFSDYHGHAYGEIDLLQAIEFSANVYFMRTGLACGYEPIWKMGHAMGLGQKTGIHLDGEVAGLLPDEAWKRRVRHEGWWPGDTCNFSIGQGATTVTPLQMAVLAAALANGGRVWKPRVVLGTSGPDTRVLQPCPAEVRQALSLTPRNMATVREGMRNVVMSDFGTGARARVPGVVLAGKTGTAEFGRKEHGRNYAWMIAFGPFESPRYALAMVIEEGESGGATVAPRVKGIFEKIFALEKDPGHES